MSSPETLTDTQPHCISDPELIVKSLYGSGPSLADVILRLRSFVPGQAVIVVVNFHVCCDEEEDKILKHAAEGFCRLFPLSKVNLFKIRLGTRRDHEIESYYLNEFSQLVGQMEVAPLLIFLTIRPSTDGVARKGSKSDPSHFFAKALWWRVDNPLYASGSTYHTERGYRGRVKPIGLVIIVGSSHLPAQGIVGDTTYELMFAVSKIDANVVAAIANTIWKTDSFDTMMPLTWLGPKEMVWGLTPRSFFLGPSPPSKGRESDLLPQSRVKQPPTVEEQAETWHGSVEHDQSSPLKQPSLGYAYWKSMFARSPALVYEVEYPRQRQFSQANMFPLQASYAQQTALPLIEPLAPAVRNTSTDLALAAALAKEEALTDKFDAFDHRAPIKWHDSSKRLNLMTLQRLGARHLLHNVGVIDEDNTIEPQKKNRKGQQLRFETETQPDGQQLSMKEPEEQFHIHIRQRILSFIEEDPDEPEEAFDKSRKY